MRRSQAPVLSAVRLPRRIGRALLALSLVAGLAPASPAQTDYARLVVLKRPNGQTAASPLVKALVTLTGERGSRDECFTDEHGRCPFGALQPGNYRAAASDSTTTPNFVDVNVRPGQSLTRTITLDERPQPVAITESTQPSPTPTPPISPAPAPLTETVTPGRLGVNDTASALEELPNRDRRFAPLFDLLPSTFNTDADAFGGVTFNGQPGSQNVLREDGVNVTPLVLSSASFQDTGALIFDVTKRQSFKKYKAFEVSTSNYPAKLGTGTGAELIANIDAGTKDYHGEFYEYFTHDALGARNFFDLERKPELRFNLFGFKPNGPIHFKGDKTYPQLFYFVNYEGIRAEARLFLNPATFSAPAPGALGDLPRGLLRAPSVTLMDFSVRRELSVGREGSGRSFNFVVDVTNVFSSSRRRRCRTSSASTPRQTSYSPASPSRRTPRETSACSRAPTSVSKTSGRAGRFSSASRSSSEARKTSPNATRRAVHTQTNRKGNGKMVPKRVSLPYPPGIRPVAVAEGLADGKAADARTAIELLAQEREEQRLRLELLDARLNLAAAEDICGATDDTQDVELYNGTLGVSVDFVRNFAPPVGQLQWRDDLADLFGGPGKSPGNVSGVRWGSGALIGHDLYITAGHCFGRTGGGWQRPKVNGVTISESEIAELMHVNFNFQLDGATKKLREEDRYPVVRLLEFRAGQLDYAIVQLGKNDKGEVAGERYGTLTVASSDLTTEGSVLCVIQHPNGQPKKVEAGPLASNVDGRISYDSIDTLGGSSGSPILNGLTGEVVGVHTNGGCTDVSGFNLGVAIGAIRKFSSIL